MPWCASFALVFGVCYGGASWLATRHASLPAWNLPFESHVPFVPSLAIVYLTIIPALILAPFVLRTRSEIAPFAITLCVETLIATVFFVLMPQRTAFIRPPVTGWIGPLFDFANALNLESNQFPSLHVAFAVTAAWAYGSSSLWSGHATKLRTWLWSLWCLTVISSAWLTWEHHFLDLLGGAALAILCIAFVNRPLQLAESRRVLWVEACCLAQCARFSLRHVRYFVIFLAIWGPSLRNWRERRVVRVAFCTAQWIDDLLDGDRPAPREPGEIIDALLEQMTSRRFTNEPLSRLTDALFVELARFDAATDDFIALVKVMRRDRLRVLDAEAWSEPELDEHHRRTFHLSIELMLKVTGCRARASEVTPLVDALAWCSTFRDLDDDLRMGLNNVPREIVDLAAWTRDRRARATVTLEASARAIEQLDDQKARRILGVFQRSIERFARRTSVP